MMNGVSLPTHLNSHASSVPILTGTNFSEWKEQVEFTLGVLDLDLALLKDKPDPLTDKSTHEEKTLFNAWERSDRLSIMFLRMTIASNIKTSLPKPENAKDYMKAIEERFKTADKSLAGKLMADLTTIKFDGFERLSVLGNLETLQLGQNKFNSSILSSLGGLSSLKYLYLHNNEIEGAISVDGLNNLTSLRDLKISSNHIEGFKSFHELEALSNLRKLYLSGNEIDEFVFSKDNRGFGKLSRISLFNITSNGRRISLSLVQSLAKFPLLKTLDLGDNNLEGTILAQGELQYVLMSYLAMEI
ncbi:hypothetical protein SADUNF_Sadunf06G0044200 [Salix dunnii]|uniref:Uncharacterized protein n=1 Tax=Salix dunnii TaxID=1413687 RepID=A0A835K7B3_9ROSI|nr:hypothetical protein SADUNF_Sadunf06G0044200 [Salix dunnii]